MNATHPRFSSIVETGFELIGENWRGAMRCQTLYKAIELPGLLGEKFELERGLVNIDCSQVALRVLRYSSNNN